MKLNKRQISGIAVLGIIAVVFILITLVVPFDKPAASWAMFAFSLISIVFGGFMCLLAFKNTEKLMSKFYGFPVFRIGVLYIGIQLILTVIIYIIGANIDVPFWVGFLISILLLGAAAIGCITTDNARDIVEEIDQKEYVSTRQITLFQVDISEIVEMCKDEEVKQPLKKLAEKFKYSDPVSSPATADKEKEISDELENLKDLIRKGTKQDIITEIEKITILLSTRNKMCEIGKK